MGEFELIEHFFRRPAAQSLQRRGDVVLGIGDDAALLLPRAGMQLVAALDTLVEGRHFPAGSSPRSIGHRALAVNLSDLGAMGAEPAWFLLALTLPAADATFLEAFAAGMLDLAAAHGVALVGGDTTAGPLSVSVQALGFVETGTALRRAGAKPGDLLYVSGTPGDAAAGLQLAMHRHPASLWMRRSVTGCSIASIFPCRALHWAGRCAVLPAPASMFQMDWPRTPASWPPPAAAPPSSKWSACRFPQRCARMRVPAPRCWRWAGATTTNCVSPSRRTACRSCPRWLMSNASSAASAGSKPVRASPCWSRAGH